MTNLSAVHDRLRAILAAHTDRLVTTKDGPEGMTLNFTTIDDTLLAELEELTAKGIPGFRAVAEAAAAIRR
jgi:hypothetical protein